MPLIIPSNSITGGYEVDNSLRFNDDDAPYLDRTPASASNQKTFTYSFWVKRANISTAGDLGLVGARVGSTLNFFISFQNSNQIESKIEIGGVNYFLITTALYRDPSAWYHIVFAVDTTQATASNRVKLYVNGSQVTSFSTETYPALNGDTSVNAASPHYVGAITSGSNLDGYMAETVFIDGTALDPTSFGEFDEDSGIWKPIDVSGLTFGTNGFYLDFEDSAALGDDVSGNGNDFTVNNLTAIDQTTDTPTNNFATWNPLINTNGVVYSEGNLKANLNANASWSRGVASSYAVSQGKWYWEIKQTSSSTYNINGVVREDNFGWFTGVSATYLYNRNMTALQSTGKTYTDGTDGSVVSAYAYTTGDILMFALDMTNRKMYIGKNGTWFNSGDPSSGSGEIFDSSGFTLGYAYSPSFLGYDLGTDPIVEANFGSPPYAISSGNTDGNGYGNFEYAVPSGYLSLCTANISEVLG